jgi:putative hydrolase of the HAD superfamily
VSTVGLDGDDTLWRNEERFQEAQAFVRDLVASHAPDDFQQRLLATEGRNLRFFGYGVKGFTLSMIETVIEVTDGGIPARQIQRLIELGKEMLEAPVELLPGAGEAVARLAASPLRLLLVTKGDLFDQEERIARSGLADLFDAVEIVSEKDEATYRRVLGRHQVEPPEFLMAGNSVRSDVLPVLAVGGVAALIPYPLLWGLEAAEAPAENGRFLRLQSLAELPDLLGV